MAKRARSARALQDEASRRIQRLDEIVDEGVRVRVPPPEPHPRDRLGRNWDIRLPGQLRPYERPLRAVIDRLRDEADLEESVAASSAQVDPFGDVPGAASRPPAPLPVAGGQVDGPGESLSPRKPAAPVDPFGPLE